MSADNPTMAFHASITNPFGKGALINLLRQFGKVLFCCMLYSYVSIMYNDQIVMISMTSFVLMTNFLDCAFVCNIAFFQLHLDKKQISVGFIGYPNVGKSSIINTLRKKKVCKTAPIAGETKVGEYISFCD